MADRAHPGALQVLARLDADEAGRSAVDLARHLRREGWRAFVASAGGALERKLGAAGATHLPLPLAATDRWSAWRNAQRLRQAIRAHKIALVHARAPGPVEAAARAARFRGVAFVTTCHEAGPALNPADRRRRAVMTSGMRVIAVSDSVAGELVANWGADPKLLRVVRRWVDLREFDPQRVRGHRVLGLAERLGIAPGTRLVAVPGALELGAGHLLLIEAVAGMTRQDFTLLFLGPGEPDAAHVREIMAQLRAARLEGRVRFAGEVADLPAALALADTVVLPASLPDPSGLMAIAAQAMGRPVIVSDQGALPECVMPASTGWLVPPGDAAELGRALDLALALHGEVRERLAARARGFVAGTFGMEAMCARTVAVYRELVPQAAASPHLRAAPFATGEAHERSLA